MAQCFLDLLKDCTKSCMAYDEGSGGCLLINNLVCIKRTMVEIQNDINDAVNIQKRAESNYVYQPTNR